MHTPSERASEGGYVRSVAQEAHGEKPCQACMRQGRYARFLKRVLSPAAILQPTSIAQISGVLGPSDVLPALGFHRARPGPSIATRQAQPALASRSNTAHGFTPESTSTSHHHHHHHHHHHQTTPTPTPAPAHPAQTFTTTSMRNSEARYNPLAAANRHAHGHQRASNSNTSGTLSSNSILASRMEAPSRLGQSSRVAFEPGPGVVMHGQPSAVQTHHNPLPPSRSPQPGPSSSSSGAPMLGSHYSYQPAPPDSTSLLAPPTLTSMHRRSPSPALKLNTHPGTVPRPTTAASNVSNRQATFIDSPVDYYSHLGSKVPALPPTSAYDNSPQSSVPTGTLFSIQTPDVTPTQTQTQSFETQQRRFAHPQRHLSSQPLKTRAQAPSYDTGVKICVVCFESEPTVRFAARSPTGDCMHGATVCTSCLESHILVAIHHSGNVDVRCPHEGCGKILDYRDVYASVRDWSRLAYYETLLLRKEADANKDFVWCKNPKCKSGQVHKAGKFSPTVVCITCGSKSCFNHDRPWHEGLTCEQFDKQRQDEEHSRATDRYIALNTKECPKCHRKIERNGGCDHMVCRPPGGCGHEFCWECMAGHKTHTPGCSHYERYEITRRPAARRRRLP